MPFCKQCGNELEPDAGFCPECGTPVVDSKPSQKKPEEKTGDYQTRLRDKPQSYGVLSLENLPAGHVVDERYEVKRKLGQGGFGAVYLVFDRDMNIDKALKIIPEEVVNDKEAMFDLQQEAQTMISLNHPNIVRVYDFHKTGSIKYIDMEYIDGKTLTDIKLEHHNKQIPEDEVKEYAVKIAEGLAYAHSRNVIHKDIKPQNVMITQQCEVKLMDFGIAETVRTSMSRIQNSSSSGTLVYMSPEQLLGKDVGKESDIYSFGAMLYELLSGHPPFYKGDINYQILSTKPDRLEVSAEMNELVLKCLEKEHKNRFINISEIISALGGSYHEERNNISLKKRTTQSAGIKKLVSVTLTMEPEGAEVKIDGKPINSDSFKFPEGSHTLQVKKEGYRDCEVEMIVSEDSTNDFLVELESLMGSITVECDTSDCKILLDGKDTGEIAPHTFKNIIPDHDYKIMLESDEYYSEIEAIRISELEHKLYIPTLKKYSVKGMVFVKGGIFQMGSNECDDEKPTHTVTIDDFYIGKHPVTQKEWKIIMGNNPSYLKGDNLPVEQVNWYDAVEFCNKKSIKEGLNPCYTGSRKKITCNFSVNSYRLPTEAEWEFASRGGMESKGYHYSGSNIIDEVAWYPKNSGVIFLIIGGQTAEVGLKHSNELGIYDMSGNVWEWCNDWYESDYNSSSSRNNPKGPSSGSQCIIRGGSFLSHYSYCQVTSRYFLDPYFTGRDYGFRLARTK